MSKGALVKDILAHPEQYDPTLVEVARWLESPVGKEASDEAWREIQGAPRAETDEGGDL